MSKPPDRKAAAHEALSRRILTLDLAPGVSLDETQLSAEFGLSRTPMREVLRQLAHEGYAARHEHRGVRVAELSPQSLRGFFLAAPMIYAAILRLAAQHRTERQLTALEAAQAAFVRALEHGTAADRAMANTEFHRVTGDMAANPYLAPSFSRLLIDHARISMTFYQPHGAAQAQSVAAASTQHDAMIAAIADRDADRAASLAHEHWQLSRHEIERFVMPTPLEEVLGAAPKEAAQ
ncbi:MAG: GntR family transcriptional regulator [Pseudomonadota bacterium]